MVLNWKACGTTNEMRKKRHILFGSGRGNPRCKRFQNCCFVSLIKKQTVSSSSIGCAPSSTSFITALHIESQRSRSKSTRLRPSILMSTHSSVIASETREDSLFLVKKNAGATQLERFTDAIADELVEEMGIRPSCNFESNTVVFVEGKFDEKVYAVWMKRYDLRSSLIESGGYSNVQFYANAKILQRRAIRVEKFAVFDGDTVVRGDAKQAKKLLNLNEDHVLELDEANLEQILAQPKALLDSFPSLHQSEQALKAVLNGVAPASLKAALDSILRTV